MSSDQAAGRQNHFDIMRHVAAFFVILTHSYSLLGLPEHDFLYRITRGSITFSTLGLWIFFTLSGYLVTESAAREKGRYGVYWFKRFLRIVPAFYATVVVMVLLGACITDLQLVNYITSPATWSYFKNLTIFGSMYELPGVFTRNFYPRAVNGSIWSIPYEVALYILPPLYIVLEKYLKKFKYFILAALVVIFLSHKSWAPNLTTSAIPILNLNYWVVLNFGWYFFAGLLLSYYKNIIPRSKYIAGAMFVFWVLSWFTRFATSISALVVPYMLVWLAHTPIRRTFFKLPVDLSYGLYLYAFPVQQLLVLYFGQHLTVLTFSILSLVCTLPIAYISWVFIEKPALNKKNAFNNRPVGVLNANVTV